MRVGTTPFHANVDYEVFQKITDRQLLVPNECEPEVVDIVDRLLQLLPENRLGAGPPGGDNDYEALKNHAFFKGINWEKLDTISPPIPADRYASFFKSYREDSASRAKSALAGLDKQQASYFVDPSESTESEPKIDANAAKMNSAVASSLSAS